MFYILTQSVSTHITNHFTNKWVYNILSPLLTFRQCGVFIYSTCSNCSSVCSSKLQLSCIYNQHYLVALFGHHYIVYLNLAVTFEQTLIVHVKVQRTLERYLTILQQMFLLTSVIYIYVISHKVFEHLQNNCKQNMSLIPPVYFLSLLAGVHQLPVFLKLDPACGRREATWSVYQTAEKRSNIWNRHISNSAKRKKLHRPW